MTDKLEALLSQQVDLSALPHATARYVENLRGMLEDVKTQRDLVMGSRLGLYWSAKSYEERFDDWRNGAVVPVLDEALSRPEGDSGNLIIEGDNIDALRVLARTHKGKVDCVFIDPPYNTENTTFVYNDDYVAPEDKYRYSMWLEGLKRRLEFVPDLLSERGVLLVAINDKNRAYIELLIKEQIMPGKFKGSLVWRTRQGKNEPGNANLSVDHETVLVFTNDGFAFGGREKTYEMYRFNDHDGKGPYRLSDMTAPQPLSISPLSYYPIQDPDTGVWYPSNPDAVWRFSTQANLKPGQKTRKDTMERLIANGKVMFPKGKRVHTWHTREELDAAIAARDVPVNGKGVPLLRPGLPNLDFFVGKAVGWGIPAYKRHKEELVNEYQPLSSWVMTNKEAEESAAYEDNDSMILASSFSTESAAHLKAILGEKAFNYAKPPSLITNLLRQATGPGSLVLDFFGGSGTTAEAVLRLNQEDDGDRRFILVSNTEQTPDEPDKNLCRDVLRRRVDAVMDGFTKGKNDVPGTGGGYAYLRMERHLEETICGPNPFELTWEMAVSLCQMSFGLPVAPLTLTGEGFAAVETEETAFLFVPEWSKPLAPVIAAEFAKRPGKEHVLVSDFDRTPTLHLRAIGCESAKCVDGYVIAGRLCGPAPVRGA